MRLPAQYPEDQRDPAVDTNPAIYVSRMLFGSILYENKCVPAFGLLIQGGYIFTEKLYFRIIYKKCPD
jgi:hypothetical protein